MKAQLVSAGLAVAFLLTGCQSAGVTVPPGGQDLKPCAFARVIAVEDLEKIGKPGCDMAGTTIRFPDGTNGMVGSIGANKSWSYSASPGDAEIPTHFTMVNWGVPGVAVAEHNRGGWMNTIWANSTEASDLLFEALRKDGVQVDEPH
jgi:hypothetical protein